MFKPFFMPVAFTIQLEELKTPPRKLGNDGFGRGNLQISNPPPQKKKGQKHLQISHFRLMEEVLAR